MLQYRFLETYTRNSQYNIRLQGKGYRINLIKYQREAIVFFIMFHWTVAMNSFHTVHGMTKLFH